MRSVPTRPPGVLLLVVITSFVTGPVIGLLLGQSFASSSELAQVLSVFVFPLAFAAGLCFWFGLGVLRVIVGGVWNLLRGRVGMNALDRDAVLVPPGYGAFLPLSVLGAGFAGLVTAVATATPWTLAIPIYAASGATYGYTLRQLAHHGYLPFPEPE